MRKIWIMLFLVCVNSIGYGSLDGIIENKLLNIKEIDSPDKQIVDFALGKIDSLRSSETVVPFVGNIKLESAYVLEDYPNIFLFSVGDNRMYTGTDVKDPYELFIYNSIDSSIYPFENCFLKYSAVFHSILGDIIYRDTTKVMELSELYIHTLNSNFSYTVIKTIEDLSDLWQERENSGSRYVINRTTEEIQDEMLLFKKKFRKPNVFNRGNYLEIRFMTWNDLNGSLEFWNFRISETVFELYEHYIALLNIGPYNL